ncbi:MAG TPA: hypothetical protein GX000_00420 [Actinomyces sp.]|nr:hypothetical protein [Acidobacteriota bacterium]HHT40100.1 hypothetical protein [Actinomyces sp.]
MRTRQGKPAANEPRPASDNRGTSYGGGRILMGVFWVVSAYLTFTSLADFFNNQDQPLGPRLISVLAALGYVLAASALTHNGRRMRMIGWVALIVELGGVLITGLLGLGIEEIGAIRNVWADFGANYYYVPLVLPILGLIWMWFTNPRRIVEIAETFDRQTKAHS